MSRPSALVAYGDESDVESDHSLAQSDNVGDLQDFDPVQLVTVVKNGAETPQAGASSPATIVTDSLAVLSPSTPTGPGLIDPASSPAYSESGYPFLTTDIDLPPSPPGFCNSQLLERVEEFMTKKDMGHHFNDKLRNNKDFQNPHICEKLVEHLGLDEFGSCCPKGVFDPRELGTEFEYDALALRQKQLAALRAREQARRTQVDFAAATAPSPPVAPSVAARTAAGAFSRGIIMGAPATRLVPPRK